MRTPIKLAALAVFVVTLFFLGRQAGWWAAPDKKTTSKPSPAKQAKPVANKPKPAAIKRTPPPRIAPMIQVDTQDDPKGGLRLEGQVIDKAEKPVGGAVVAIDTNPPRTAKSEADGSFAFDGLLRRDYSLEAHAGDAYAGKVYLRLTAKTEPVILRMRKARTVRVMVADAAGGKAIAGAKVTVRSTASWDAQTGADGVATFKGLGADDMTLHVRAKGFAPVDRRLVARGDKEHREHVTMSRGAKVSGTVVNSDGKPVAGARVVPTLASEPFTFVDRQRDGVVTDRRGRWSVPAVAPGTYRFSASGSGYASAATAPILIDGVHPRDGVEIVVPKGATVTGTVTTGDGAPAVGAEVRLVPRGMVRWRTALRTYTDDKGTFSLTEVPRRVADIVAKHRTGSSALVEVDAKSKASLEVTLPLSISGSIAGVVVDDSGDTIAEAQVYAEPEATGGIKGHTTWAVRGAPLTIADAGGRFRFVGLPDGNYRVRAARPGASEAAVWLAAGEVVAVGKLDVRLVLPAPGGIKGKVLYKDGSAPKAFTIAIGPTAPTPFADDDGSFYLAAPGGKHNVFVSGPSFTQKIVEANVTGKGIADLGTITVERGRSVSGRVLDASGAPVAKALVAAGALLSGDGAKLYIPDESIGARKTETDDNGRFLITGFGKGAITVVAGRDGIGRSRSIRVPPGAVSAELDLVLTSTGKLSGKVTRDGKPVAETVIIASPVGATASNFFVVSGVDGSFALDALAPGHYIVYPMIGGGGPKPKDMFVRPVHVVAGEHTEVDIDFRTGPATVQVVTVTDAGAPVAAAQVFLLGVELDAPNMEMLRDGSFITQMAPPKEPIPFYLRMAFGGPAKIAGVTPGRYTACVIPLPIDPRNPLAAQRLRGQMDRLPMKCTHKAIGPDDKAVEIRVTVPAAWTKPKE